MAAPTAICEVTTRNYVGAPGWYTARDTVEMIALLSLSNACWNRGVRKALILVFLGASVSGAMYSPNNGMPSFR